VHGYFFESRKDLCLERTIADANKTCTTRGEVPAGLREEYRGMDIECIGLE